MQCSRIAPYVQARSSGLLSPSTRSRSSAPTSLVAEKNFGGSLVEANLRNADRNIPVKLVTASRGKAVRAEPVAHLYARGEVDHAGTFAELEQQATEMATAGYMGQRSPDRLDAMVWALSELSGSGKTIEIVGVF
jgi:phage terminase large subunit-like protein